MLSVCLTHPCFHSIAWFRLLLSRQSIPLMPFSTPAFLGPPALLFVLSGASHALSLLPHSLLKALFFLLLRALLASLSLLPRISPWPQFLSLPSLLLRSRLSHLLFSLSLSPHFSLPILLSSHFSLSLSLSLHFSLSLALSRSSWALTSLSRSSWALFSFFLGHLQCDDNQ